VIAGPEWIKSSFRCVKYDAVSRTTLSVWSSVGSCTFHDCVTVVYLSQSLRIASWYVIGASVVGELSCVFRTGGLPRHMDRRASCQTRELLKLISRMQSLTIELLTAIALEAE
jgi:hypothetical protein